MTIEQRQVRAAQNQALFREVNERLEGIAETFQFVADRTVFACECARESCSEQIALSVDEYETLRRNGNRFAVKASEEHVFSEVERIVERHDQYWVVQKIGAGAELANATNPREDT